LPCQHALEGVYAALDQGGLERAEKVATDYVEIFGEGNYYFEIQNHHYRDIVKDPHLDGNHPPGDGKSGQITGFNLDAVQKLSPKLGIEIVAPMICIISKNPMRSTRRGLCVQTGHFVSEINRLRMIDSPDLYLKSPEEMAADFKEIPGALETSLKIAAKCNLEIPLGQSQFPFLISR